MNEKPDKTIRKPKNHRCSPPCDEEIRYVFHRIWTSQVGTEGYKKKDWLELQNILFKRGINT